MKRILWVLAALLVLLCGVAAAEGTTIVDSGNCGAIGSSVTWQLDSAGTLTIAGAGDMEDYPGSTYVPWYFNRSSIRTAVVQEGVESIGDNTFYGCSGLTSVSIPGSVYSIGDYAFYNCSGLNSVSIPGGVASIGASAFSDCSGITSVYTDSLEGWLRISFGDFNSNPLQSRIATLYISGDPVTDITIPDGITKINDYAFRSYVNLTGVSIPASVTSIGNYAFYGCTGLSSVSIPEGVTSIGNDVFSGCTGLSSVSIPETIASIGNYTFYGCTGLSSVSIPETIASIGNYTFYGCTGLSSVSIPEGVTTIGNYTFLKCTGLSSVSIPESLRSVGLAFFRGCNLKMVHMAGDDTATLPAEGMTPGVTTIYCKMGSSIDTWAAENGYTCVYTDDLAEGEPVTLALSESALLITVGEHATLVATPFPATSTAAPVWESSAPEIVSVEGGVLTAHASGTANITATCGLGSAECAVTARTVEEMTILGSGECGASGSNVTWELNAAGTLTIAGTGDMEDYPYTDYTSVPWYSDRTSIRNVIVEEGVTSIGDCAFWGCSNLTGISIPTGVTSIGEFTFNSCSSLTGVSIPEGVTSIDTYAFAGCSSLASVSIPDGVTYIGSSAFSGCSSLTSISIPEGVTSIGRRAFLGCSNLTTISISASVTSIGVETFDGCSGITSVYTDSLERWLRISFSDVYSNPLQSKIATLYISGNPVTKITIPDGITAINDYAFYGYANMTGISIPTGVTSIGTSAFSGCSNLTGVSIPGSVTSIGDSAFSGCSSLTGVSISEGVASIGTYAFFGCSGLTGVSVPEGVTSIGDYAFRNCTSLTSVSLPESLSSARLDAFKGCNLKTVFMAGDHLVAVPVSGMTPGETTIYCKMDSSIDTWAAENGYTCVYTDDLAEGEPVTLALSEDALRLPVGENATLVATPFPATSTAAPVWVSSDPEIVSVEGGVLTAHASGTATITATCGLGSDSLVVTVFTPVESFELSTAELWIVCNETAQLSIGSILPEGAEASFNWVSSDSAILSVDESGRITAEVSGEATVTANSDNGIERSCLVHVCYPVTAIEFDPAELSLAEGDTAQLCANVTARDSSYVNRLVTFASSDENVASMTADGIVTAKQPGTATITATASSGVSAACTITVHAVQKLILPALIQSIEEEAFAGTAAEIVILTEGCASIGARAFADSAALTSVYMPDSVTDIADNAFTGSDGVAFRCASDNAAAAYARAHGIPCTIG